jgi:Fe-S-cluster formation regulator IscX/YfhJ
MVAGARCSCCQTCTIAWMCFCPRLRGSGAILKPAFRLQVAEEAAQELRPLLPRLVRHRFLQRRVQGVEEFDQDVQHLQRRRCAGL